MNDVFTIYHGHAEQIFCVAWSPDGQWLASGSRDTTVQVWNPQTRQLQATFRGHDLQVMRLAWSPDGSQIASCSFDDEKVRIWEAMTGQAIGACSDPSCDDQCLAWSPDGHSLAAGGYSIGLIYRTADQTCLAHYPTGRAGPTAVAWSLDSSHLAWASGFGHLYIRDVASGRLVWRAKAHGGGITDLTYAPDGRFLASCGFDATIQIRESATGALVRVYRGHPSGKRTETYDFWHPRRNTFHTLVVVWSLSWSPDSRYLASASGNTMRNFMAAPPPEYDTVQVWEAVTGRHLQTYRAHTHEVRGVAWSSDGTSIASASLDGTVHVWKPSI
ncbi:WD40 repeat domain-containing protein [Ktedonobacter sp. SOSP1-52]|uniref:WD40 repeat domain-containing protein n=1 Tax=Ktedonobacter sp. SOSP1-52 TaxID=2778366 RepID=UPI001914EB45|nr:WD40 repeat domain-containing protein [Ktedonobacter sp. SOSP1-52]